VTAKSVTSRARGAVSTGALTGTEKVAVLLLELGKSRARQSS